MRCGGISMFPHHFMNATISSFNSAPSTIVPLLVAYDISDDRRRTQLHRLLRGFGEPLQKSLFLCWVNPVRRKRLQHLLDDFLRTPHPGRERVDCVVARDLFAHPREIAWVLE